MSDISPNDWKVEGHEGMTKKQQRMLNAVCGDLADQLSWHGNQLTKDDWRHMVSGTILGWRMMPAIDRGEQDRRGQGFIMLGGSSMKMSKSQAADAITALLQIGDHPDEQGLSARPIRWSDVVLLGLGHNPNDFSDFAPTTKQQRAA